MQTDIRFVLLLCAHGLLSVAALWIIATSNISVGIRIVAAVVTAAVLLPWLPKLAARELTRASWLALLLVLVIGAGIVEVLATGAQWPAIILLGSAMLEFALLTILGLRRRAPATNERVQP